MPDRQTKDSTKLSQLGAEGRSTATSISAFAIRAVHDLRRGWRVVLPNLEQCALLEIAYKDLNENATHDANWRDVPLISQLPPADRCELLRVTLDFFRHEFALHSETYLSEARLRENATAIRERLRSPWRYDDEEDIPTPTLIRTASLARYTRRETRSIGPQSGYGKFVRNLALEKAGLEWKAADYTDFIDKFLNALEHKADYLKSVETNTVSPST